MADFPFSELNDEEFLLLFQSRFLQEPPNKTVPEFIKNPDNIFDQQEGIDPDGNLFAQLHNTCVYSEQDEVSSTLTDTTLNFIEINARSLQKNFLSILLYLEPIINKSECILFTETWFTKDTSDHYSISGFEPTHIFRKGKRGGGDFSLR